MVNNCCEPPLAHHHISRFIWRSCPGPRPYNSLVNVMSRFLCALLLLLLLVDIYKGVCSIKLRMAVRENFFFHIRADVLDGIVWCAWIIAGQWLYCLLEWILDKLHNPGGNKTRTMRYTSLVNAKCIIGFQWDTQFTWQRDCCEKTPCFVRIYRIQMSFR